MNISSKSFIGLVLTFRSMIYFRLTFVYGVGKGSNLILLHANIQLEKKKDESYGSPVMGISDMLVSAWASPVAQQ